MTPAAGQGALALQASVANGAAWHAARALADEASMRELIAERAAVALLEASCATPIGVHAKVEPSAGGREGKGGRLLIEAFVGLPDGSEWIRDRVAGDLANPAEAGELIAERLQAAGAREILERAAAVGG